MVSGDAEGAANEPTKGSPSKSPSRNPSLLRGIGAALGLRRLSPAKGSPSKSPSRNPSLLRGIGAALGLRRLSPERGSTSSLPMSPPQVPAASSQSSPTSSLRSPDAPSSASATSEAVLSTGAAAPVLASTPETPTPGSSDSVTLTGAIHGSASSAIPAEHHSPGIRASSSPARRVLQPSYNELLLHTQHLPRLPRSPFPAASTSSAFSAATRSQPLPALRSTFGGAGPMLYTSTSPGKSFSAGSVGLGAASTVSSQGVISPSRAASISDPLTPTLGRATLSSDPASLTSRAALSLLNLSHSPSKPGPTSTISQPPRLGLGTGPSHPHHPTPAAASSKDDDEHDDDDGDVVFEVQSRIAVRLAQVPEMISIAHQKDPAGVISALADRLQGLGATLQEANSFSKELLSDLRKLATSAGSGDDDDDEINSPSDSDAGTDADEMELDDDIQVVAFKLADPEIIITAVTYAQQHSKIKREDQALGSDRGDVDSDGSSEAEESEDGNDSSRRAGRRGSLPPLPESTQGVDVTRISSANITVPTKQRSSRRLANASTSSSAAPSTSAEGTGATKGKGKARDKDEEQEGNGQGKGKGKGKGKAKAKGKSKSKQTPNQTAAQVSGNSGSVHVFKYPSSHHWHSWNEDKRTSEQAWVYKNYEAFSKMLASELRTREGVHVFEAFQDLRAFKKHARNLRRVKIPPGGFGGKTPEPEDTSSDAEVQEHDEDDEADSGEESEHGNGRAGENVGHGVEHEAEDEQSEEERGDQEKQDGEDEEREAADMEVDTATGAIDGAESVGDQQEPEEPEGVDDDRAHASPRKTGMGTSKDPVDVNDPEDLSSKRTPPLGRTTRSQSQSLQPAIDRSAVQPNIVPEVTSASVATDARRRPREEETPEPNPSKRPRRNAVNPPPSLEQSSTDTAKTAARSESLSMEITDVLARGNIPPCWHQALILVNDILACGPLSPDRIINRALTPLTMLQTTSQAKLGQGPADGSVSSSVDRMEKNHSTVKAAHFQEVLEHLHLFSLDRQAKVDTATRFNRHAERDLDNAKRNLIVKEGGVLSSQIVELSGRLVGGVGPQLRLTVNTGSSTARIASTSHTEGSEASSNKLATINAGLKPFMRSGRLYHQIGMTLGSVMFLPFVLLSPVMDISSKIRKLKPYEVEAITLLLRGARPVPSPDLPFTAEDQDLVDAIIFGVRGYLPRVLSHATARAESVASNTGTNSYADVLLVRDAVRIPRIGNAEPSIMQAPLPAVKEGANSVPSLNRVYGLAIPGSRGATEIITRTPAFISDQYLQLIRMPPNYGRRTTIKEALSPNPNRSKNFVEVEGEWPAQFGVDLDDVRTCQLLGIQPKDVLPYSSAYARHFGLDVNSEAFKLLCRSIQMKQRFIFPILPAARLVDVTEAEVESESTGSSLVVPSSLLQAVAGLQAASTSAARQG